MHREHAIEDFRRNEIVVRMHQLDANDECLDSTDREKQQRREHVENPQPFVIDSGEPLMKLVDPRAWLLSGRRE